MMRRRLDSMIVRACRLAVAGMAACALIVACAFVSGAAWASGSLVGEAWASEAASQVEETARADAQGLLAAVQQEAGQPASGTYDAALLNPDDGTSVWLAFDLARTGFVGDTAALLDVLQTYVTDGYASSYHGLDDLRPTTWSRTIALISALGGNPQSFGTNADGKPADLVADGITDWSYTKDLGEQGSNAWIWALVALNASGAQPVDDARYTAQTIVDGLLACQASDGSFALHAGDTTGSVDVTGMALAALAPYRDQPAVAQAIEAATGYLSKAQRSDGRFADDMTDNEPTCESTAMVVIGLAACGINPDTDERFIKEGTSALAALLSFRKTDGTFAHDSSSVADTGVETLPSEQALRAMIAYLELLRGGDGNAYTADIALALALSGGGTGPTDDSIFGGRALISFGVGVLLGLVVVAILWVIHRVRKHRRA